MAKYSVEVDNNILSLVLFSEELDFILAKEIKRDIERQRDNFQGEIEKAIVYLHDIEFIDTSGINLLMHIYRYVCTNVELKGCREGVSDLMKQLKIDNFIKLSLK